MRAKIFFASLLLTAIGVGQDFPSFADCEPRHHGELSIRVSPAVEHGRFLKGGRFEDPNLKHDASRLRGNVEVRTLIDPSGKVVCAMVISASSPMLSTGALEAVKTAEFKSYEIQQDKVFVEVTLRVHADKGVFKIAW
ncbi:MAG: energy transducer TonB [Terriglobales bacterium]|jgi:hypothetical protein